MSFNILPHDIIQLIIYFIIRKDEASKLSITSKNINQLVKQFYTGNIYPIHTSLQKWKQTFPNAIYAHIWHGYTDISFCNPLEYNFIVSNLPFSE